MDRVQASREGPGHQTSSASVGRAYWQGLEDPNGAFESGAVREELPRRLADEYAHRTTEVGRRRFLQLMAASLGLAGFAGCRRPESHILPFSKPNDQVVPGLPTYYATAMPGHGAAVSVLVESHEGRPTKIEGNPGDPDGGGATDARTQASILGLYDPERSRVVLRRGQKGLEESTWAEFDAFANDLVVRLSDARGRGLCILSEDVASPALDLVREHMKKVMPEARWYVHDPIGPAHLREGMRLAFHSAVVPRYRFERADVVVALDCDFLGLEDEGARHARAFGRRRGADAMNRLYDVGPSMTLTGGMADHRLQLPACQVQDYAIHLARAIFQTLPKDLEGPAKPLQAALAAFRPGAAIGPRWIHEVAADLREHQGRCLVVAGRRQPPLVHALAQAINVALGNRGETVVYHSPRGDDDGTIEALAEELRAGKAQTLVVLGGNPAHDAPADLDLGALLERAGVSVRLGLYADETSARCTWHLPEAHYLESWGDARAPDGTVLPIQPLIEPLFGGRVALELMARLVGFEATQPYQIVRKSFGTLAGGGNFEDAWRRFLHDGHYFGAPREPVALPPRWEDLAAAVARARPGPKALSADNLELVLQRDPKLDDGRFANNGWLQELPDPITKLTWDNAAVMAPRTARALGVDTGDVVKLELDGRSLEIPALVQPGQADFSIAVALGHGRRETGRVGRDVGFNAYVLRATATLDIATGLKATPTGRRHPLAITQDHFLMEGRDLVRERNFGEASFQTEAGAAEEALPDIQERPPFDGEQQWGMAIDLNLCTGCGACTIACQAENNIPIVGKEEVMLGREMHWIRVDRYFNGPEDDPRMLPQPVACVHCENAPCEVVCPVNAAVHNDEGLNLQVYNRCVGTRYCSNNCPYKVRRFNYFDYNERPLEELYLGPLAPKGMPETFKMQKNPDVTVRMRGVMEKCTYCVQRIERGKIGALAAAGDSANTRVPDGTIVPACAQACPAQAIVFGDVSDPESHVSRVKRLDRDYALLGELNTKPRTSYQARLRNPNPKMAAGEKGGTA